LHFENQSSRKRKSGEEGLPSEWDEMPYATMSKMQLSSFGKP
jgi:hypothetical protein